MGEVMFALPDEIGAALLRAAGEAPGGEAAAGAEAAAALSRALGREVSGILLFGSRARGEATPVSDVDALVFAAGDARGGLRGTSAGVDLDIEVIPAALLGALPAADYFHVAPGRALHDPTGAVADLLARVEAHRARGPAPMSAEDLVRARLWARRMCARVSRSIEAEPALAEIQIAQLIAGLLEAYFQARALWTRSARQSLRYWDEHEPALRRRWDEYAAARDPGARVLALERLAEATFAGAA